MNIRKHAFALIFGIILAIAAGGTGFLLFKSRSEYQDVKSKLAEAENRYDSLTNAQPYPSPENVEVVEQNAEKVQVFYDELLEKLCENQPVREDVTKDQFNTRLQNTWDDLREQATNDTINLKTTSSAGDFHFGFEQYQGVLPERKDIPRLLIQLRMVESLCRLLFDNKIQSLESVKREVFEGERARSTGGGMAGMGFGTMSMMTGDTSEESDAGLDDQDSDLYSIESFDVVFTARDSQVWSILDALGSSPQFTVVTSVGMKNLAAGPYDRSSMRPTALRGRAPSLEMEAFDMPDDSLFMPGPSRRSRSSSRSAQPTEADGMSLLPRDDRMVAGRDEFVEVTLSLDVYRFCPEDPDEEEVVDEMDLEVEG